MPSSSNTGKPLLSLSLRQGQTEDCYAFQLNRESSGLNSLEIITLETLRPVALVCSGLDGSSQKLHLLDALQSSFLELVEEGTEDVIRFESAEPRPIIPRTIPPKPSPQQWPDRVRILLDSTNPIWKETLTPSKTYTLRFSPTSGEAYAYYTDIPSTDLPSQRLPIARCPIPTISLRAHNFPAPPLLFANLSIPETCHLSGTPPFVITLTFSTNSRETLTFDKSRTPLSSFIFDFHGIEDLIDCIDTSTGKQVDWPAAFGCFDFDPRPKFPADSDFVQLGPGQTWVFTHTVCPSSNSEIGGLEELEVGKTYSARPAGMCLTGFSRWKVGRKEDLLAGDEKEKKERWKMDYIQTGALRIEVGDEPVLFRVVQ
jgi:hypothetical protein